MTGKADDPALRSTAHEIGARPDDQVDGGHLSLLFWAIPVYARPQEPPGRAGRRAALRLVAPLEAI